MRLPAIDPDLRNRLAFWALAGLALFVTHDAIYLVQIGPGESLAEALRTAGHGYWAWASLGLTAVALVAGTSTALRVRHLRRRASDLGAAPTGTSALVRRFAGSWWRLAAVVAIGFAIQENLEHVIAHGHAPGVGVLLGPESPLAMPVIGLVSAIAAAVSALVAGTQEALIEAIGAALRIRLRAPRAMARPPVRLVAAIGSILAHPGAGRAPPTLVVSAS